MKTLLYFTGLFALLVLGGCEPTGLDSVVFEDAEDKTIFDYLTENEEDFSSFISILEKGGLVQTLSAYNPHGNGYTLFVPDNDAVDKFIAGNDSYSNLDDLLNDQQYVNALGRFHILNMEILSNEFPFGAFPKPTLSEDFLTVSFIIEEDSSYYKINNTSTVIRPNIETSNGYVHQIQDVLVPIIFTTKEWLESHSGFEIFSAALKTTGLESLVDINYNEDNLLPVTVLAEPDSVYENAGISSIEDLIGMISPLNNNYTDPSNPLYNFVSYHILSGNYFLGDFIDLSKVYNTYSEVPLNINGLGLDLLINKGKQNFDTIINNTDTTIVDYILFYYDLSNITTKSGSLHFIDRMMKVQRANRTNVNFQFWEEPLINEYRKTEGAYLIEKSDSLQRLTWTGSDLYYAKLTSSETTAWGTDYLEIEGDFSIQYRIPKVIQGNYLILLRAEAFNSDNASVEVFVDNKKIGGLIDLSTGGNATNPFRSIQVGTINFSKYSEHVVEIRPLIPGRFLWDAIIFEIPK